LIAVVSEPLLALSAPSLSTMITRPGSGSPELVGGRDDGVVEAPFLDLVVVMRPSGEIRRRA